MRVTPRPGTSWRGPDLPFTCNQVACPLLARWEEGGDKDPWLLLTDWLPEASEAGWEGLQVWLAQGVQITKRAGGQRRSCLGGCSGWVTWPT